MSKDNNNTRFLALGYKAAIVLAFFALTTAAAYLFCFLLTSNPAGIDEATMVAFNAERRMTLLSTGIFVGMAFGFLGFGLFLIQAKGEVEGSFEGGNIKLNITRMSPGLFVIACATAIIIACISFKIEYTRNSENGQSDYVSTPNPMSKRPVDTETSKD